LAGTGTQDGRVPCSTSNIKHQPAVPRMLGTSCSTPGLKLASYSFVHSTRIVCCQEGERRLCLQHLAARTISGLERWEAPFDPGQSTPYVVPLRSSLKRHEPALMATNPVQITGLAAAVASKADSWQPSSKLKILCGSGRLSQPPLLYYDSKPDYTCPPSVSPLLLAFLFGPRHVRVLVVAIRLIIRVTADIIPLGMHIPPVNPPP
jgi:hypothetical protein